MQDSSQADYIRLVKKIEDIKRHLHDEHILSDISAGDVINTVAISEELAGELKEILLMLHTTAVTTATESKMNNYKIHVAIIGVIEEIIAIQTHVVDKLEQLEARPITPPTGLKNTWSFLKAYKTPVSIMMVIVVVWVLTIVNPEAMSSISKTVPAVIRGVK